MDVMRVVKPRRHPIAKRMGEAPVTPLV